MNPRAIDVTNPPREPPAKALPSAPQTVAITSRTIRAGPLRVSIFQPSLVRQPDQTSKSRAVIAAGSIDTDQFGEPELCSSQQKPSRSLSLPVPLRLCT